MATVSSTAREAAGAEVERFASPPGRLLGLFIMVAGAVIGVLVVAQQPAEGRGFGFLCTAVVLVAWVVMVRPAVAVHEHGVLLTNMLRDTFVPSSKIERCRSTQTLRIAADGQTYQGLGITRSARSMMKENRTARASLFGGQAGADYLTAHRFANEEQTGGPYAEYVESRIEQLASDAKPDARGPVVSWAWPSAAALALALACLGLLFL